MRHAGLALLLLAACICPAVSKAESQCPWINTATVAASSGASVILDHVKKAGDGGECLFQYPSGKTAYRVLIVDASATRSAVSLGPYESRCASKATRLSGIGNEAFLCRAKPLFPYAARVIGRVRNQVFIIDVSADSTKGGPIDRNNLRDQASMAAEQVAGNLF